MEVFARELGTPITANIHWGFQAQNDEGMSPLLLAASYPPSSPVPSPRKCPLLA